MKSNNSNHHSVLITTAVLLGIISSGYCQKQTQEDPCKVKSRVVGDATYCDRYWECVDNQPELYDCPNGLVFAGKNRGVTEGCDYPWRANYCDGKTQANGPIGREHCDWLYGIFGHETSCTRYWTCWNGTATEQLCIGGLLYNENTHSCDWPENVDGCQKHPLCNEDSNGNVPLGKSCNRYWQCQGGYPRLQRCPAMLVFDKRSLRCVVPPTEDCEIPTTLPPPPEEADEEQPQENLPRPQSNRPTQSRQPPQSHRPQHQQQQHQQQQHQQQQHQPQQHQQQHQQQYQQQNQQQQQQFQPRPQQFQQTSPQPRPQQFQQSTQSQQARPQQFQQSTQSQARPQQFQAASNQQQNYQPQQQQQYQQQNYQQQQQHQQNYQQQQRSQQRADSEELPPNFPLPAGAIPVSRGRARSS